jgi:hypothetical protein
MWLKRTGTVTPFKRPHRWTGRPMGPPPGSQNHLRHGLKSTSMIESRRAYAALLKAAREAICELREFHN